MKVRVRRIFLVWGLTFCCGAVGAQERLSASVPAKFLFSAVSRPASLVARSIGFYSRGCLAGAVALPVTGPSWQVMRLSRSRNWGHPRLVAYLERLARDAAQLVGPACSLAIFRSHAGVPCQRGTQAIKLAWMQTFG